jgi:DNA invertase Pin-like site-specific DNA recombinase
MTKKVVFYARAASMAEEASIVAQIESCNAFAAERGWSIVKTISDIVADEVLFKARPGIKVLFAYIELEPVDIVLCAAPADIVADRYRTSKFISELRGRGVELWSTTLEEPVTLRNLPHVEREDDGVHYNGQPNPTNPDPGKIRPAGFGYKLSCALDASGKRIAGYRVVDPEQADVVRRIYRMYAAGRSEPQIADALNAEGVKGPGGKPWNEAAIRGSRAMGTGILHNPIYAGRSERLDGSFNGYVSALRIVSDELWQSAQDRHASHGRRFRS